MTSPGAKVWVIPADRLSVIAFGAAILTVVGCLAPWVTTVFGSIAGVSTADGQLTVVLATSAVLSLAAGRKRSAFGWVAVVTAAAAAVCGGYESVHLTQATSEIALGDAQLATAGWGVYLVAVAGAVTFVASLKLALRRRVAHSTPVVPRHDHHAMPS